MADEPFAQAAEGATALAWKTGVERHDVAVVLGSGWTPAAERFGETVAEVAFADLPGFPSVGVSGHAGVVRSIRSAGGGAILAFMGRVHAYEGHPLSSVVHGVRTAITAGCRTVVVTNAAGGLRDGMQIGQAVLISDHINLTGLSPLTGLPAPEALGLPRFVDLTDAYSARLREIARSVEPSLEEGVYAGLPGPHYETPAEIRMLRTLGADLVGMSTVHEVIAARQMGAEVLGLSLVTNIGAGLSAATIDHAEVLEAGEDAADRMGNLLAAVVSRL
jgi:purine-nucleoside phosphorylase